MMPGPRGLVSNNHPWINPKPLIPHFLSDWIHPLTVPLGLLIPSLT